MLNKLKKLQVRKTPVMVKRESQLDGSTSSHLSDVLADVLDDHLVGGDGFHGEQTPVVDV